ncbi:hypothetical protein ES703_111554 [subsurface metagenome]
MLFSASPTGTSVSVAVIVPVTSGLFMMSIFAYRAIIVITLSISSSLNSSLSILFCIRCSSAVRISFFSSLSPPFSASTAVQASIMKPRRTRSLIPLDFIALFIIVPFVSISSELSYCYLIPFLSLDSLRPLPAVKFELNIVAIYFDDRCTHHFLTLIYYLITNSCRPCRWIFLVVENTCYD